MRLGLKGQGLGVSEKILASGESNKWFVKFINVTFIVGRKRFNYDGTFFSSSFRVKICPITLKICKIEGERSLDLYDGFVIEKAEKIICSEKFSCLNITCPLVDKGEVIKHMRSKFRLIEPKDVELFLRILKKLNNFIKEHLEEIKEGGSLFLLSEVLGK